MAVVIVVVVVLMPNSLFSAHPSSLPIKLATRSHINNNNNTTSHSYGRLIIYDIPSEGFLIFFTKQTHTKWKKCNSLLVPVTVLLPLLQLLCMCMCIGNSIMCSKKDLASTR